MFDFLMMQRITKDYRQRALSTGWAIDPRDHIPKLKLKLVDGP